MLYKISEYARSYLLLCMCVNLCLSHSEAKKNCGFLRIGCSHEYLELKGWNEMHNKELDIFSPTAVIRMIKSNRMNCA